MTVCKSCGRPILWIRTKSGKVMPVDPDQKILLYDPKGKDTIITAQGEAVRGTITNDYATLREAREVHSYNAVAGYISHFATCPNAAQHRKRRP